MENKKLIAITGASSGIGAAMAKAFSLAGYPLLLMARRIELMEAMSCLLYTSPSPRDAL